MSVEHRPARYYVALPMDVTVEQIPHVVGDTLDRVAELLSAQGVTPRGEVIRYDTAFTDGTFGIEVGHLVDPGEVPNAPFEPRVLPEGMYSVARHDGPYAELGMVTRALMDSWAGAGVQPAMQHTATGDDYACWYELYLAVARDGPYGPEGPVEVCVLTAS